MRFRPWHHSPAPPLHLLRIEIGQPCTAEGADSAEPEGDEAGDHVHGAAEIAALAHDAAGGGDREHHRDQKALRQPEYEFALARRRDQIGAGAPAADEPRAADRPPGPVSYTHLTLPTNREV